MGPYQDLSLQGSPKELFFSCTVLSLTALYMIICAFNSISVFIDGTSPSLEVYAMRRCSYCAVDSYSHNALNPSRSSQSLKAIIPIQKCNLFSTHLSFILRYLPRLSLRTFRSSVHP